MKKDGGVFLRKMLEDGLRINKRPDDIKRELVSKGFAESEVDSELKNIYSEISSERNIKRNKLSYIKHYVDSAGYGLASNQIVNILFLLSGGGLFLIGLLNAFKGSLSTFIYRTMREYAVIANIKSYTINLAGIIFGFSFIMMALSVVIKSPFIFSISMIVGSIGIVVHGGLYRKIAKEGKGAVAKKMFGSGTMFLGVFLTGLFIFISAFLIDSLPLSGKFFTVVLFGSEISFRAYGFLFAFEITAILFILSSFLLSKMNISNVKGHMRLSEFRTYFIDKIKTKGYTFTRNKSMLLLTIAALLFAVFSSIIYSYSGIYVYTTFKDMWLGGFLNVAVVFGIPIMLSILGPMFAAKLNQKLGLTPLLVFGVMLFAIFPFTLAYNQFLPAIVVASVMGVLGSSILGVAKSLIVSRLLNKEDRELFYAYSGLLMTIPFLLLTALFLLVIPLQNLQTVFLWSGIGILLLVLPVYMILVSLSSKGAPESIKFTKFDEFASDVSDAKV